jgi:nicotinamidase-related amidase
MTYGFVDPKSPLAQGRMGFEAAKSLKPLLEKARAHGVPIIYTTGLNSISYGQPIGISRKVRVNPEPWENEIIDMLKPGKDDIVVPKGKASVRNHGPCYFFEIAANFPEQSFRSILLSWSRLRQRDLIQQDMDGKYSIKNLS